MFHRLLFSSVLYTFLALLLRGVGSAQVQPSFATGVADADRKALVASAMVLCPAYREYDNQDWTSPVVGAVINQTTQAITDVELEVSIFRRDNRGRIQRWRDKRVAVVPSLNNGTVVSKLEANGNIYFTIPGYNGNVCPTPNNHDLNLVAIAVSRINGKYLVPKSAKAPLETMLPIKGQRPAQIPTQRKVIEGIRQSNELLHSTIVSRQLNDCLASGTWACSFNNNANINVLLFDNGRK